MSATEPEFNPEDYDGLQPKQTVIHRAELRKLRKADRENEENKARIAQLERRDVFSRAGIPLDDPGAPYFIKGYDGEMTPEAIKAAAVAARIPVAGVAPPASPEEMAGHQAAQAAAQGGTPPGVAPDFQAKLAEMSKKHFAPADDVGRAAHIEAIRQLAKEAGANIPIYPGT